MERSHGGIAVRKEGIIISIAAMLLIAVGVFIWVARETVGLSGVPAGSTDYAITIINARNAPATIELIFPPKDLRIVGGRMDPSAFGHIRLGARAEATISGTTEDFYEGLTVRFASNDTYSFGTSTKDDQVTDMIEFKDGPWRLMLTNDENGGLKLSIESDRR